MCNAARGVPSNCAATLHLLEAALSPMTKADNPLTTYTVCCLLVSSPIMDLYDLFPLLLCDSTPQHRSTRRPNTLQHETIDHVRLSYN